MNKTLPSIAAVSLLLVAARAPAADHAAADASAIRKLLAENALYQAQQPGDQELIYNASVDYAKRLRKIYPSLKKLASLSLGVWDEDKPLADTHADIVAKHKTLTVDLRETVTETEVAVPAPPNEVTADYSIDLDAYFPPNEWRLSDAAKSQLKSRFEQEVKGRALSLANSRITRVTAKSSCAAWDIGEPALSAGKKTHKLLSEARARALIDAIKDLGVELGDAPLEADYLGENGDGTSGPKPSEADRRDPAAGERYAPYRKSSLIFTVTTPVTQPLPTIERQKKFSSLVATIALRFDAPEQRGGKAYTGGVANISFCADSRKGKREKRRLKR